MEEINIYKYEEELEDNGYELICGVDEVGRGSIAGPLVVSAVILPINLRIKNINDSKKLTKSKREELYNIIKEKAIAISTEYIFEEEIDKLNIYIATKTGMLKAINSLSVKPQHVLIDAMTISELDIESTSLIKGDMLSSSIAAASIIAKVERDKYMEMMDIKYPGYGFKSHKGYCTKQHVEALRKLGPCPIHRKSFFPVNTYFIKQVMFDFDETDD